MLNKKYLLSEEKEESFENVKNPHITPHYILSIAETKRSNYPERRTFFYDAPDVIEKFPNFIKTESFLFLNISLFEEAIKSVELDDLKYQRTSKYGISTTSLFAKFNPFFESSLNSDNNFTDKELINFINELGYKDSSKILKNLGEKVISQENSMISSFQENEIKDFLNRFPKTYQEATNDNFDYVVKFGKKVGKLTEDMPDSALGFLLKQISSEKLRNQCTDVKDYFFTERTIEKINVNLLCNITEQMIHGDKAALATTSLTSLSLYRSEEVNENFQLETTTVKKPKIK